MQFRNVTALMQVADADVAYTSRPLLGLHFNTLIVLVSKGYKRVYSWFTSSATGPHLPMPYGITQCYLPPETSEVSERASP